MNNGYPPQVIRVDAKGAERGFANPGGTIPFPQVAAGSQPIGLWSGAAQPLMWVPGTSVARTATWGTLIFDLRPELRAADSQDAANAFPLWRVPFGSGVTLFVYVGNLTNPNLDRTSLTVTAREFSHPSDSRNLQQTANDVDVTLEFMGAKPAATLMFVPPGYPYPVRYWKVALQFDIVDTLAADPALVAQGSVY